ncbi:MAG: hypothetical protein LCI00_24030 [Chloroflexi bacterium]|nr:hypothetical protein [Chloroflexota bacterium]MCC6896127.1 hypothetical protein [Anaerolineae bacterium]
MRYLKRIAVLLIVLSSTHIQAQTTPTIDIVLGQPEANPGEIVRAEIYIRNGVNIGGADIGIAVDETCLRIINRTTGTYLPSENAAGGFSPFSELHDHDTRFAAAITDRTKLANGDGVFYTVDMQVTCENGIAPLTVVFAELSAYKDPSADQIEFIAYSMATETVNIVNTQLTIGMEAPPLTNPQPLPIIPIVLIGLTAVGIGILITAVVILRLRMADDVTDS